MKTEEKALLQRIRTEFRRTMKSVKVTGDDAEAAKSLVKYEHCFYCGDFDHVMPYDRGEEE